MAKKLNKTPGTFKWELEEQRWRPYIEQHASNKNGPTALLRDLSTWLEGDALDLFFSWPPLQDKCNKAWTKITQSLSGDPDWDPSWSRDPGMGVKILEHAAANESDWGKITLDDPEFATFLRKAHEAIQAVIFEPQEEPATNLGIFDLEPEFEGTQIMSGDYCVTRLMKEHKRFFQTVVSRPGMSGSIMYENWPDDLVPKTRFYARLRDKTLEWNIEKVKELTARIKNRRVYVPEADAYFRIDENGKWHDEEEEGPGPCPDCQRCKGRKFLGHRYPGQYLPREAFSYNPNWRNEHHGDDSEDDHDHGHGHHHDHGHDHSHSHDHNGHAAHGHHDDGPSGTSAS